MKFLSYIIIIGFIVSPIVEVILCKKLLKERKKYSELLSKYDELYNSELQKVQNLLDDSRKEQNNEGNI